MVKGETIFERRQMDKCEHVNLLTGKENFHGNSPNVADKKLILTWVANILSHNSREKRDTFLFPIFETDGQYRRNEWTISNKDPLNVDFVLNFSKNWNISQNRETRIDMFMSQTVAFCTIESDEMRTKIASAHYNHQLTLLVVNDEIDMLSCKRKATDQGEE